ncbi:nuclear transport factor 2A [Euphorbia peplus]|nr:nuclear transport factor 2A [Euphorbia peplus]
MKNIKHLLPSPEFACTDSNPCASQGTGTGEPSGPAGGMLVFVSGNLQLATEQHALKFSQLCSQGEAAL